ncbi:DCST2 protein, partial [Bucorvus abyssinicus]|nr:DCST2 protein [Bucorvus abyssinicus]
RSTGGFVLGMALASLYGALVLLMRGHNIWYCLVTTISLGTGLGLGMAFSANMRLTVLLSLPHIFTREGKVLMLLLVLGMAVQGPCTNILHNFSRAAESLSCGAELALNQTAERLQRAQEPLLNALSEIKDIAHKAKVVGDRVRKFFRSIMDSVSHIGERGSRGPSLVPAPPHPAFSPMGRRCNREMGKPFQRCLRIFDNARDNCKRAIPFLFVLCYLVDLVKPYCGLANRAWVPAPLRTERPLVAPAALENTLDRVRQEFEFNISAVHHFDISLNASKSLGEVALDIMEDVGQRLEPTRWFLGLFMHLSFCAILYMYLQALRYRHRYLRDDHFDNFYITRRFVEIDLRRAEQGRPTVLPLTIWESGRYITPAAPWLSKQERRQYGLQLVGVLRHVLLGLSIILGDYSLFWLLDLVRHQLQGEIVARAPEELSVTVNGTGYASDIFRDLVSAFDALQQGNVSVLSQRCLLQPVEPDYGTYLSMGILYGICIFIAVFGSHVARLRRVVCAAYYPSREQVRNCPSPRHPTHPRQPLALTLFLPRQERMSFLHSTILARRAGLFRALRQATMRRTADSGQGNLFLYLTTR